MMAKILASIVTVAVLSVLFVSVFQLTLFLSSISNSGYDNLTYYSDTYKDDVSIAVSSSIIDVSLLIIFIVQHSFTSSLLTKIMSYINAEYMQRLVYNLLSSVTLLVIMKFWHPIPQYILWSVALEEKPVLKIFFSSLHVLSWLLFYIMAISLDITEILGIKWVYYHVMGLEGGNLRGQQQQSSSRHYLSSKFSNLKNVIPHPGFICLTVILWFHPIMRLDRLFLAVIWTLYMALAFDGDDNDLNYVIEQRGKKFALK